MTDLLATAYPWVKSFHVISVIAWMAGLFYLPRLFVYHTEKGMHGGEVGALFPIMEQKLLRLIMNPAMIATWAFGLILVATPGVIDWTQAWPWFKAVAVLGMTWFHMWCAKERKALSAGRFRKGSHYRKMNEVPTFLMVIIVIAVIARPF